MGRRPSTGLTVAQGRRTQEGQRRDGGRCWRGTEQGPLEGTLLRVWRGLEQRGDKDKDKDKDRGFGGDKDKHKDKEQGKNTYDNRGYLVASAHALVLMSPDGYPGHPT